MIHWTTRVVVPYAALRIPALCVVLVTLASPLDAQRGARQGDWRATGGDAGQTRYSPLDQITRDNVGQLRVAWIFRMDNFSSPPEARSQTSPIMANGRLFFTAGATRAVVAANPGTGEILWVWKNDEGARAQRAPRRGSGRGVAYWSDGRDERVFTITPGFRLVALDAATGRPAAGFGEAGVVDLFTEIDPGADPTGTIGNSSPPVVIGETVIVGPAHAQGARPSSMRNTKGDVMAFDVRTGRKRWQFHTIARPGEPGYETWGEASAEYTGNAGVWTPFTADEELGYVYLPVEAPTSEYYGGHRAGNNLYSSSLVALDAKDGRRVWHYQLVHHDIWDYDISSPPILMDITSDGRPIKAVVQPTKQGYLYVFDRVTGRPVWPIEERPVPQTDVPGEWTSPTQPIPTKPPAFDRIGFTHDDLIDFTPELRRLAIEALRPYRMGPLYVPPSLMDGPDGTRGSIMLPGNRGGANWNAGAVDPETGFLYVASVTRPTLLQLVTAESTDLRYVATALAPPLPTIDGLPLQKPPYGRIVAFDMNTGEIAWQMANGDTPPAIRNHPKLAGVQVPRTGSISHAGLLATKTLLFAGEGDGGMPAFRAHDKQTGRILWETSLPAGPQTGLPVTYMYGGKQYIVFATGGSAQTGTPALLVAYALASQQ
ncbi:MAG: pyrroloquinoline quinone-dependent dehydrogenase [Acidobacteria bacterium]|nr:pyrroloquinoline quinone-dependent dehydrogenase [Acidobacteriota bacterium]